MINEDVLRHAHQLLGQGQVEETEILLAQIAQDSSTQDTEIAYLQTWCAMERNQWEEVVQRVCEPPFVTDASAAEAWLVDGSVRRRRPAALFKLGAQALALGYQEEATVHYRHCLSLLQERRMNIPAVRILVHAALGTQALATGDGALAMLHYTTALSMSDKDPTNPLLATLYVGLSQVCFQQKVFDLAIEYGLQGLPLLEDAYKEDFLLVLSQICTKMHDFLRAHDYASRALTLAREADNHARLAKAHLQKALISYEEGEWSAARYSVEEAWEFQLLAGATVQLHGSIASLGGQIAEAAWGQTDDQALAEEALAWYDQAQTAFATIAPFDTSRAEIAERQARLYEAKRQPAEALAYWKMAYQLGNPEEMKGASHAG